MYCPSTILVNNDYLWVCLITDGDYIYKRFIPKTFWINPVRYEIGLGGCKNGKRKFFVNRGHKYFLPVVNTLYKIRNKTKCF